MRRASRRGRSSGFSFLELVLVIVLIGLATRAFVVRFNYWRYRMDGNVRLVQNAILAAQQTAVQRNVQVQVMIDADQHRVRILQDYNANGIMDAGDTAVYRPLVDGARFAAPGRTLDGAAASFVTGAGMRETGNALQRAFLITPGGQVSPSSGSGAGDVVVYLGSPRRVTTDERAVQVIGATTRSVFWSRVSGQWRQPMQ
jgi:Tfp pilus assembly protein FimT